MKELILVFLGELARVYVEIRPDQGAPFGDVLLPPAHPP